MNIPYKAVDRRFTTLYGIMTLGNVRQKIGVRGSVTHHHMILDTEQLILTTLT